MSNSLPVIFSLLDTPAFGGAEQYLTAHLQHLCQQGYPIFLATNNSGVARQVRQRIGQLEGDRFVIADAPYLLDAIGNWKGLLKYLISLPLAFVWFLWTLHRLRKKHAAVICFFAGWSDRVSFSPLVKLLGCRLIWIEFGPLEPVFQRNRRVPKLLYELTKKLPDHFVTISESTQKSLVVAGQISSTKISLVYPGIKLWTTSQLASFQKLGCHQFAQKKLSDCLVIGYLGRLASEHQLELLLQAFAEVKKNSANSLTTAKLKLLVIGDGPERESYHLQAKELGISNDTFFTGFVDEVSKFNLLSCCDVFVFPGSWSWEGFGITTIEALSLGLPVITPNFGPQKEIIQDGVSGLHFRPNDVQDLRQKIEKLISDKGLRQKLATGAKARAACFNEETSFRKMEKIVECQR